jgi:transposase
MRIHEMHALGLSLTQIAQQLGLDRKTVRKYVHRPPEGYGPRPPRVRKLDPNCS